MKHVQTPLYYTNIIYVQKQKNTSRLTTLASLVSLHISCNSTYLKKWYNTIQHINTSINKLYTYDLHYDHWVCVELSSKTCHVFNPLRKVNHLIIISLLLISELVQAYLHVRILCFHTTMNIHLYTLIHDIVNIYEH